MLQVDLVYPKALHDQHNDFPMIAEQMKITADMLSSYNKDFLKKNKIKFTSQTKLCPNFNAKQKYVCSLENLQLYIKHGIKLERIESICSFKQTEFMAPFISLNSELRKLANSPFKRDNYKLMNNSQFGKFIEDVMKRTKVEVCNSVAKANFLTTRPQYKGFRIIDSSHALVQRVPGTIKLNSPIACGAMVLEKSKAIMLRFWYQELKPRYGDKISLILSDTDSFIFEVTTDNVYQDMYNMRHLMDLSDYSPLSPYFDGSNRKVPGKFKDETPSRVIAECVALKPKMYSLKSFGYFDENGVIQKNDWWSHYEYDQWWERASPALSLTQLEGGKWSCTTFREKTDQTALKGVTKAAKRNIRHEAYLKCLRNRTTKSVIQRTIRASKFKLYSLETRKRALSAFDDKKYLLPDGKHTLAYGHYRLKGLK